MKSSTLVIMIYYLITFVCVGSLVGFLAGLFGIGGGVLLVTIFSTIFEMQGYNQEHIMHSAIGTSLACILFTATSSMIAHIKNKNVDFFVLKKLVLGIVIGTILGGLFANYLSNRILEIVFAVFLTLVFIKMLLSRKKVETPKNVKLPIYILVGSIIGFKSSILGIGGGTISIPFLNWSGKKMKEAVGISASLGVPIALFGTLTYIYTGIHSSIHYPYSIGHIQLTALFGVIITSWYFAKVGARVSSSIDQIKLKKLFTIFLGLMLLKSYYACFN